MLHLAPHILTAATECYTDLHRHPELSFKEFRTAAYLREVLSRHGIFYEEAGPTGTIGFLPGRDATRTIALRADIDALPIQENTSHRPVSETAGCMHACGHDLHAACLLGAALQLKETKDLPVNVLLIFQHAEEVLPGGAEAILASSFFRKYRPEWIVALHCEPELPTGSAGICPGRYMASGDEIYITLRGPGGHAALPEKTADLVLIASHIVVALQQITSRKASPLTPTVLTFGNIRCDSAMNVIPRSLRLEGTFRTFDETWRAQAKEHIRNIACSIATGMGAACETEIIAGYPDLYNDPEKASAAFRILRENAGFRETVVLPRRMTTEDFARYSQTIPATFIRIGVKGAQESGKLHTPDFCADPAAISYGIAALCALAIHS